MHNHYIPIFDDDMCSCSCLPWLLCLPQRRLSCCLPQMSAPAFCLPPRPQPCLQPQPCSQPQPRHKPEQDCQPTACACVELETCPEAELCLSLRLPPCRCLERACVEIVGVEWGSYGCHNWVRLRFRVTLHYIDGNGCCRQHCREGCRNIGGLPPRLTRDLPQAVIKGQPQVERQGNCVRVAACAQLR